jgi:hypothetical protein
MSTRIYKLLGLFSASALLLSVGLAWISSNFGSIEAFGSFLAVILFGGGILAAGWWVLQEENLPTWVGWLMVGTAILRMALGVIWFLVLPSLGHGTEVEMAGYVMSDAHRRDTAAWDLAQSGEPLTSAFRDYRQADQYGGLLFLSAAVYRYLGGDTHHPLMMVVLTASFSALTLPFSWAFSQRLWGRSVAKAAVWILAIYPEALLLGSSQMREAFMMTLSGAALFGLVRYWQDRSWGGVRWVIIALGLSFPLSSLFAILLLSLLILMVVVLDRSRIMQNWRLWGVLGGLLLVGMAVIWLFAERIYPGGASNPLELISHWLVFAGRWEKRALALSSGWFDKVLSLSPEWMHIWLVLGYGTVQPFLPAALIALGNWTWRLIAIWRALGWTVLLVLLMYAPIRALRRAQKETVPLGFALFVWAGILLSAYRGGGDQWDNPRYRVIFVVLQAALAAWVWVSQQEKPDPWFRRVLIGLGLVFAWFAPWYLRRYSDSFTWPVVNLFKTLGLGFVTTVLYWIWDWARCESQRMRIETDE